MMKSEKVCLMQMSLYHYTQSLQSCYSPFIMTCKNNRIQMVKMLTYLYRTPSLPPSPQNSQWASLWNSDFFLLNKDFQCTALSNVSMERYSHYSKDKSSEYFSFTLKINDEFHIVTTRHCVIPASNSVLFLILNRIHGCCHLDLCKVQLQNFGVIYLAKKNSHFTSVTAT